MLFRSRAKGLDIGRLDTTGDVARQLTEREGQQPSTLEVLKSEAELKGEEKPPVEEAPPAEEPVPMYEEAKKVAKELSVLDPEHPYIATLKDLYNLSETDIATAKAEVEAIKAEKAKKGPAEFEPIVDEARTDTTELTGHTKETQIGRAHV